MHYKVARLKAHVHPLDFRFCFETVLLLNARFWMDVIFTGTFAHFIVSRWHIGCFHPLAHCFMGENGSWNAIEVSWNADWVNLPLDVQGMPPPHKMQLSLHSLQICCYGNHQISCSYDQKSFWDNFVNFFLPIFFIKLRKCIHFYTTYAFWFEFVLISFASSFWLPKKCWNPRWQNPRWQIISVNLTLHDVTSNKNLMVTSSTAISGLFKQCIFTSVCLSRSKTKNGEFHPLAPLGVRYDLACTSEG